MACPNLLRPKAERRERQFQHDVQRPEEGREEGGEVTSLRAKLGDYARKGSAADDYTLTRSPLKPRRRGRELTWSIQTVVNLGAVVRVVIAIIVVALAYLVYKASKKGSAK